MLELVRDAIVWDNHGCLPLRPDDERFLPELERYRRSGVTVVGLNVGFGSDGIESHVRMLAHFRRWLLARPDEYVLVSRIDDVHRAKATGRLGVFFDIEGANAIGDQLSMIGLYYDLGVRWMLMAYNAPNRVGGGCMEDDTGLTPFGAAVVAEMERVGMIVCCSHTGERTALEVIERAVNPVIFSHSNPRAVWDHPRNISDRAILACAAKGGVIGINGVGAFLGANDSRSETVAKHIDYVARLAGIEHVALGLDYVFDMEELLAYFKASPQLFGADANLASPQFVAPEQLSEIVAILQSMGYVDADIRRILGENLLRLATIWK